MSNYFDTLNSFSDTLNNNQSMIEGFKNEFKNQALNQINEKYTALANQVQDQYADVGEVLNNAALVAGGIGSTYSIGKRLYNLKKAKKLGKDGKQKDSEEKEQQANEEQQKNPSKSSQNGENADDPGEADFDETTNFSAPSNRPDIVADDEPQENFGQGIDESPENFSGIDDSPLNTFGRDTEDDEAFYDVNDVKYFDGPASVHDKYFKDDGSGDYKDPNNPENPPKLNQEAKEPEDVEPEEPATEITAEDEQPIISEADAQEFWDTYVKEPETEPFRAGDVIGDESKRIGEQDIPEPKPTEEPATNIEDMGSRTQFEVQNPAFEPPEEEAGPVGYQPTEEDMAQLNRIAADAENLGAPQGDIADTVNSKISDMQSSLDDAQNTITDTLNNVKQNVADQVESKLSNFKDLGDDAANMAKKVAEDGGGDLVEDGVASSVLDFLGPVGEIASVGLLVGGIISSYVGKKREEAQEASLQAQEEAQSEKLQERVSAAGVSAGAIDPGSIMQAGQRAIIGTA